MCFVACMNMWAYYSNMLLPGITTLHMYRFARKQFQFFDYSLEYNFGHDITNDMAWPSYQWPSDWLWTKGNAKDQMAMAIDICEGMSLVMSCPELYSGICTIQGFELYKAVHSCSSCMSKNKSKVETFLKVNPRSTEDKAKFKLY